VIDVSREEFEELVGQALDTIPPGLTRLMKNVVIMVEDDPPPQAGVLLGLYEGVPLTERGGTYAGFLPDRITIFRRPLLAVCESRADLMREVRVTVVHEIAHHFGIDDERLHELGW
jgi:predicted Zn-dependent protease with MMP-like domain